MVQSNVCTVPLSTSFFFRFQVDDNQGLLFNSEREEFLSPPNKSLLKRQTATGHLRGQYQASVRQKKANMAKQNGTEQAEEGKGVSLSSQTTFQTNGYHHQPYTQTQLLPQPYSTLLSHHSKSSTLQPSKVYCSIFQHPAFVLC